MIQIFRDIQDFGGDEDEGRGGTLRRLLNRGNEAIAQRRIVPVDAGQGDAA